MVMEGIGEELRKIELIINLVILINNESDDGGEKDVDRGCFLESNGFFFNDLFFLGEIVINEEEV